MGWQIDGNNIRSRSFPKLEYDTKSYPDCCTTYIGLKQREERASRSMMHLFTYLYALVCYGDSTKFPIFFQGWSWNHYNYIFKSQLLGQVDLGNTRAILSFALPMFIITLSHLIASCTSKLIGPDANNIRAT